MSHRVSRRVATIPVDRTMVPNPRARDKRRSCEIVDTIGKASRKATITVSRPPSEDGQARYGVVCGEGRLEVGLELGRTEVAAIIIAAGERAAASPSLSIGCSAPGEVASVAR